MAEPRLVDAPGAGTVYRYRHRPQIAGPAVMMLHGWGGDENSMWVLESTLPTLPLMVSLRGIHPQTAGGYAWSSDHGDLKSAFTDFEEAFFVVKSVRKDIHQRVSSTQEEWLLMGFSQGAAVAFSLAARGDFKPAGVIALAGFLPEGELSNLDEIPIYWGHGAQDEFVPIQRAEKDVGRLSTLNDDVEFCQADVGHKLGVECARGLRDWYSRHFS